MRKTLLFAAAFLAFFNTRAQVGNVSIKTWADNKKSAFCFTFDDGFLSHYTYARPILNSHGFKGSFYVITGALTETLPGSWRYASWQEFITMANEGHEISSHTVTHPDLTTISVGNENTSGTLKYELYQSRVKIEQKIPGKRVITLAYPYIAHNSTVDNTTDMYYEAARSGGNDLNGSIMTAAQMLDIKSKVNYFTTPRNSLEDDKDELKDMMNYINTAIAQNKFGSVMIHDIYPAAEIPGAVTGGAYYPVAAEWLNLLCDSLKRKSDNNDVWVETLSTIVKYMRERLTFSSSVVNLTSTSLEINVGDAEDNEIFDYPLTADITVPSGWDTVEVSQNGVTSIAFAFSSAGTKLIRTYITPDRGNLIITKKTKTQPSTYSINGSVIYSDADNSVLPGVKVDLSGRALNESVITSEEGVFTFSNKIPATYTLAFSNTEAWRSVNATDALLVLKYFTSAVQFDDMQVLAADVTDDGRINSTDALTILRRYSGIISTFPKSDWIFNPGSASVTISNSNQQLEIKSILAGDVNKSYRP